MSNVEHLEQRLRDAQRLLESCRSRARRDLLLWIVAAAVVGTVIGYGMALWLIDPVIVVARDGLQA